MIQRSVLTLSTGEDVPVYHLNTLIVGTGAAGMNCAVHLFEFLEQKGIDHPEDRIGIVTVGIELGASRMSGSDKQTYYKLGTSPTVSDSALDFARTLTNFGCMHGDVALAEAESSLREFYHLVQVGVPFPHDPEGAYVGYKTDHDPYERATSAGPKTSKFMSECLQKQAERYGITIFDRHEVVRLIPVGYGDRRRIAGIVTIDLNNIENSSFGLTLFLCENLVLAAGGPGELFEVSVYPKGQVGIHGLALAAGLKAHNLTESQFGLASTKFRWNVSGTYMQVVPRMFSVSADSGFSASGEADGEREFLTPFFETTAKMATNIFLKGYQWPFDPQRVLGQRSSLIDVIVYYETQVLGRRVFLDFTRNPIPGPGKEPFDLEAMDEEAITYLRRNRALQATPIERLAHMNPPAIEIYLENGIDIRREPLEINVCAQHHNGGFVVDKWWQSSIPHTFVIGEMAGTHGVKRPGGSALNSGQVGGLRAAEFIANVYGGENVSGGPTDEVSMSVNDLAEKLNKLVSSRTGIDPGEAISAIQRSMSLCASHVRRLGLCRSELEKARKLYTTIAAGDVRVTGPAELINAVRAEHLALSSTAFLESIVEYLESGGGSRGSFMVLADGGDVIHPDLIDPSTGRPFAFLPENESLRNTIAEIEIESLDQCAFLIRRVPVRPIPERDEPFELAWTAFRNGEVYRK
ncbi:MAG: FAD-binding protein [Armatimonadetes bacterium]|nr:FAD-binding protein [Armatimonadota bacterium]